jgi:phosphoglycolate phosphatase-like HAD superfamily hydrolase
MDKCIIIDLDETLISTLKRQYEVIKLFFKLNLITFEVSFEQYLTIRKINNFSNFEFFKKFNVDKTKEKLFKSFYMSNIENINFLKLDSLIVDIELLKEFKESNSIKLALLSLRNNEVNSLKQLDLFGLKSLIDYVYFIKHDQEQNPKIKILNQLKEKLTISCFIGDALGDYEAAISSEITFIKVDTGFFDFNYSNSTYKNINHFLIKNKDYEI